MEKETTWIDAWIRWDRNSKDIVDEDQNDDVGDDERVPPTTNFSFDYTLPAQRYDSCSFAPLNLTLNLRGFPSESEQIWNSTGLTLWPSSHHLCEYLLQHYQELLPFDDTNETVSGTIVEKQRNIRAVELGSGLGRCGLLLHHLMAMQDGIGSHIYLTDGDTDTLAQLRDNVIENTNQDGGTKPIASADNEQRNERDNELHSVSCHQLLWGKETTEAFCERHFSNVPINQPPDVTNSQEKDHSGHPVSLSCVDLVCGSDLIYAPRVIGPLFETVLRLLQNRDEAETRPQNDLDGTTTNTKPIFLMAHSDRREGSSVTLKMVLEGAQAAGLKYEILQQVVNEGIFIIAFRI